MARNSFVLFTLLLVGTFCSNFVSGVKLELTSEHDCDRHSLDALYHEKYAPETENALAEITELVNKTTELMVDSLTSIMADLPGRETSDAEERMIFATFNDMKKKFVRKVNKIKSNMTSAWESLIQANYNLMLDNGKFTLADVLNRTNYVADTYTTSRSILDSSLGFVVSSLKDLVRNSMKGISAVAETEIQKEKMEKSKKSNDTSETNEKDEVSEDSGDERTANHEEGKEPVSEESLKNKKKEVVKMLSPEFLGKVSVIVIDRDVNLEKNVTVESEDRDSVLDDMYFTLAMIRSRVKVIIQKDALRNKEMIDLARRNLYIYFAEQATQMYEDRLKKKRETSSTGEDQNRQFYKDENDLAEALVSLMENYP